MEICSNCGATTIGETCHRCGHPLPLAQDLLTLETTTTPSPKVELISRGHDIVEADAIEVAAESLDDVPPPPIPPGGVEVTVDEVTVVATEDNRVEEETPDVTLPDADAEDAEFVSDAETTNEITPPAATTTAGGDHWDHLRPHGEMPPLARRVSVIGRVVEVFSILTAVAGLGSAGIHFYLNTRLEVWSRGRLVVENIDEIETIAEISLLVAAGLAALSLLTLLLWRVIKRPQRRAAGRTGALAALALVSGTAVVATFYLLRRETATEAIAANALIILGLGLIVSSFLIIARLVDRLDQKEIREPH